MEKSGVKRASTGGEGLLEQVKGVVIQVDGVLCPASFMKEKVSKHVTDNVSAHVVKNFKCETMQINIDDLHTETTADVAAGLEGAVVVPARAEGAEKAVGDAVAANLKNHLANRRCPKSYNKLYMDVATDGFKSEVIKTMVFEDVPAALKQLNSKKIKVYAFTNNCGDTAKLMMEYSTCGNVAPMLDGFYDWKLGQLNEKGTYANITSELKLDADQILLLTHDPAEASIAHGAGLQTCLVLRKENEGGDAPKKSDLEKLMSTVSSLADLFGAAAAQDDAPAKKRRSEAGDEGAKVCVETGCAGEKNDKVK
jgi:2,3-diketo-5-methylthio-1-phosphopentane phosphatase